MESEERECREYEADSINGTGERETIDQGIGKIEGKVWNEVIRTMALMDFFKIDGANTTDRGSDIHGADFLMKLLEPMYIIG